MRFIVPELNRRCPISSPTNSNSGGRAPFNRNARYADQTRINERIRSPRVRVIDGASGKQLGILSTPQAIRLAKDQGLDLVEISPNIDPPVCKIVDYGKYKYIQEKHKKEAFKQHKASKLKEMKFRVGIDPHDYLIKITHAEDFLFDGHKVRIQLQFRGRQMAHQEVGFELVQKIKKDLLTMAHVDMEPKLAGRNINMQLSPLPERQRIRKFRVQGSEAQHIAHANDVSHEEHNDHHDQDDHHDDHHEAQPAPAAEAPAPEAPPAQN